MPSAYTDWDGKVMKLWEAKVCKEEKAPIIKEPAPGTVVKVEKDGFYVQTGDGLLKIMKLQIPGKKKMDAADFLRGYQISAGDVLKKV